MRFACFDIGGTNLKRAVVNDKGEILSFSSLKTPSEYAGLLESISEFIPDDVHSVGIGIPGTYSRGRAYCPNLKSLNGKSLGADIKGMSGKDVFVENDAGLATLGELAFFEDESTRNMILLTLGTGVGGGLIMDGSLVGSERAVFEVGHITLDAMGERCGCGKCGCFETFCSMSGLVRIFNTLSEEERVEKAADVYKLWNMGHTVAGLSFERYAHYLAHGMASLANLFSPQKIKIGGGLSELSDAYLPSAVRIFSRIVYPSLRGEIIIETAQSRNRAGILGAAALCLRSQ
ncbi:ROK family protein [Limisalsivibrio acetivorans]|uniref:ROK family protein n=1 Tax=Limisalsivibrio acetivorans TaxID=1304888 RepID=UPI0003B73B64|nr:ROK family protein [Limisalsivibrio acetivorans]